MGKQMPLTRLRAGQKATVASLPAGRRDLARLLAFGILPGTDIQILQIFPVYVLAVGNTRLAIDRKIAAGILVGVPNTPV
ncbi:FeoA family protein [Anaeroselena agilis]|uniref:FeoA family protein n=1 Tax=Anaeroselena agilis TaxID=3063788 RepID=A0ABU3P0U5_9FIRM|nr:FeoA family protein [Selenomonadales bacterium 4137-cl]